ncbi:MAG: hypothetical protein MUE54_08320, partial [Anaerolineae bacterium]|nr:hypothetical protein [Anaerolineae bacterium]
MIRKLNWVHIGLVVTLPIILALINPNWIFNPSMADDYIYLGYQLGFPKYIGWHPSETHYFIERISWILPGYVIRQIFSPLLANFIVHLGIYYLATFSVYGVLNKLFHSRIALIIAILFGQFPMVLRSTGWDYLDGYGMALLMLSIFFLTYVPHSPRRPYYLIGAGAVYLLMLGTNLFNIFYAPALA